MRRITNLRLQPGVSGSYFFAFFLFFSTCCRAIQIDQQRGTVDSWSAHDRSRRNHSHESWLGSPRYLLEREHVSVGGRAASISCRHFYGLEHIQNYADHFVTRCSPMDGTDEAQKETSELTSGTNIDCVTFKDSHPGATNDRHGEAICITDNVAISAAHYKKWLASAVVHHAKSSDQVLDSKINRDSLHGTVIGSCRPVNGGLDGSCKGKGGQRFLRSSFKTINGTIMRGCEGKVNHTTYMMADIWGVGNVWHGLEEISKMFEVTNLLPSETQVIIADAHSPRKKKNFFGIYRTAASAFSMAAPIDSLKSTLDSLAPKGGLLCFRRIIWSTWGQPSLQATASYYNMQRLDLRAPYNCGLSPIFLAMRKFLLGSLRLRQKKLEEPRFIVWTERSTRLLGNENQIKLAVQAIAKKAGIQFLSIDLGGLNLERQLETIQNARVLIGLHGAALTWTYFLPRDAAVLELSQDAPSSRCYCFRSAAEMVGISYQFVQLPSNPTETISRVMQALRNALQITR